MRVLQLVVSGFCLLLATQLACQAQPPAKAEPKPETNAEGMIRLAPNQECWLDLKKKRVMLKGEVCFREGQLEMLVTLAGTKEHEAVVAVKSKAFLIHAALLRLGAEAGSPVRFQPKYQAATGAEIDVTFEWTDPAGVTHTARGQDWVRHARTQQVMKFPFVFAGSGFYEDETTKQQHYLAEEGDVVCVSNFPTAMLDVPVASSQGNDSLLFEAFTERIPPVKTPLTVYLTPKPKAGEKKAEEKKAAK